MDSALWPTVDDSGQGLGRPDVSTIGYLLAAFFPLSLFSARYGAEPSGPADRCRALVLGLASECASREFNGMFLWGKTFLVMKGS